MRHQSTIEAMSTQDLMVFLARSESDDEGKMSWRDGLVTLSQVASAAGLCFIVNLVAL